MNGAICWVVVLGDLGRSPRMQYHASSLIKHGARVHALAHTDSELIPFLKNNRSLALHSIKDLPKWFGRLPRLLALMLKAVLQFVWLLHVMLVVMPRPAFALVQLPPSIPTLLVCWLVRRLRGVTFVYDWHNFGYSLMNMTEKNGTWIVSLAKWLEVRFGRLGDAHMCVTKAMKEELHLKWGVTANVVYDRPSDLFRPSTSRETHALMEKIAHVLASPLQENDFCSRLMSNLSQSEDSGANHSLLTIHQRDGSCRLTADRPGIVVSSTSWTIDEDFSLLIEAACQYDESVKQASSPSLYPKLLFIVTGKGPLRSHYVSKVQELSNENIAFRTVWLEPEDYPRLLGSADLGVSLHVSSSGLDLPMKIVDMYGCGLPVCALGYDCLNELVEEGRNGFTFTSAVGLAEQLLNLFKGFPDGDSTSHHKLKSMRNRILAKQEDFNWDANWDNCVLPILEPFLN